MSKSLQSGEAAEYSSVRSPGFLSCGSSFAGLLAIMFLNEEGPCSLGNEFLSSAWLPSVLCSILSLYAAQSVNDLRALLLMSVITKIMQLETARTGKSDALSLCPFSSEVPQCLHCFHEHQQVLATQSKKQSEIHRGKHLQGCLPEFAHLVIQSLPAELRGTLTA